MASACLNEIPDKKVQRAKRGGAGHTRSSSTWETETADPPAHDQTRLHIINGDLPYFVLKMFAKTKQIQK